MIKPAILFVAGAITLAACGIPITAPHGTWTVQVSATSGAALIRTENGSEILRIACRRNPADLLVAAPRLAGGSGPARLEIGAAAVDLHGDTDEPGLSATGPLTASLPAALASGGAIVLRQGDVTAKFGRPDDTSAKAFAAACRNGL